VIISFELRLKISEGVGPHFLYFSVASKCTAKLAVPISF